MNRKAITLSINFLVIIILSLVIISLSIYFFTTILTKAKSLASYTQEELDKKIESIQCEGLVCIPINYKKIHPGEFTIFGMKIFNDDNQKKTFEINRSCSGISAENRQIGCENNINILTHERVQIPAKSEKRIAIGVEAKKNALPGMYIITINVSKNSEPYGVQQIRVEVES